MGSDGRPKTAEELAERIAALVKEPTDLYNRGMDEMIAQYGSKEAIPLEARTSNPNMAEGYNRAAEVMVEVAELAFNFAADQVGASGFQADWASMTLLGKLKHIEGPYRLVRAENYLYPQHDGEVTAWLNQDEDVRRYLHEKALERIEERSRMGLPMHPNVQTRVDTLAAAPETVTVVP